MKRSHGKLVGSLLTHSVLIAWSLITLIPLAYLLCASFKTQEVFFQNVFLPTDSQTGQIDTAGLTTSNYTRLFTDNGFARPLLNSIYFASVTSVLATLFSAMGGYALAKFRFRGRSPMTSLVLGALVIPWIVLLAPTYQLLYWLGLLDTYAGLILPAVAPAFGVYLFRQAVISSVPTELIEASRIDGCSELRIFFQMVLPLVRPMVGTFMLLTFVAAWNNFIGAQIVLQSPEKMPLAVAINQLRGVYGTDYGLLMAGTVVSVLPVMALFLILQRDLISGLTAGAVKG